MKGLSILIVAAVVAVAAALLDMLADVFRRRGRNSQPRLFAALCRLHCLKRNSRRLLKQVAAAHRLAQPAQMFLDPQWLDPACVPGSLRQRTSELTALRLQLFEDSAHAI
jgi:hypothetical protein